MDAIVTLENFKLMVFALIKFLNQLSERDKAAAIKFLISTVKNSTKQEFNHWPDDDGTSAWLNSTNFYSRNQTTDNITEEQVLVKNEWLESKWLTDTGPSIQDIGRHGNFCQTIVPLLHTKVEQKSFNLRNLIGTPFTRDITILLETKQRNLLKMFLNNLIFDHSNDDRSLVRQHTIIAHLKPEAQITEIHENDQLLPTEADTDETTQKSSEDSLADGTDKNELDTAKSKLPRKKKLYKCFQCPKFYLKRKTLAVHYKFHPGFCCDCGESYGSSVEERVQHNRKYHTKQYPYVCEKCGDSMSRNQQYLSHMKTHGKDPVIKSECKRCGEKFMNVKAYKDHLQTMGHTDGARVCEFCGQSFTDETMLQQHLKRVHHTSKSHQCDYCEKSFDNRSNLMRHMNLHKDVTPNYVCEQCGASYSAMHSLKEHMNDKHTKKKMHVCEVCNREFTNRHLYKNHVVTHSEDRPFACTICSKSFKLKTNLMRHTKRCHSNVEKKQPSNSMKRPKPSTDKEESSDVTSTPPLKKPFQPFSSDSPFYKNNTPIQFQSSVGQIPATVSPATSIESAESSAKDQVQPIIQLHQRQANVQMPETFHVVETYMPANQPNPGYSQYSEQFQAPNLQSVPQQQQQQQQHVKSVSHPTAKNSPKQRQQSQMNPNSEQQQQHHKTQQYQQYHHPQQSSQSQQMQSTGFNPSQQYRQHQQMENRHQLSSAFQAQQKHRLPNNPNQFAQSVQQQQQQAAGNQIHHHRQLQQSGYHMQHQQTYGQEQGYQYQQTNQHHHLQQQNHNLNQHLYQQQSPQHHRQTIAAQQYQQRHLQSQANAQQYQPNIHSQNQQHLVQQPPPPTPPQQQQQYQQQSATQQYHQRQMPHPSGQAKARSKYEYNYSQHAHQSSPAQQAMPQSLPTTPEMDHKMTNLKYDYAYNASSPFNVDSPNWNSMTPTLVETPSGQYMPIEQIELSKFNKTSVTNETKMQYPYPNMWSNESTQMEYAQNNLDSVKPEPQHQQQQPSTAANTYNSIGNILTNLELLGNNSNFESSNFEIISSNYDHTMHPQQAAQQQQQQPELKSNNSHLSTANGEAKHNAGIHIDSLHDTGSSSQSVSYFNIQSQTTYNNRSHTITDISNTILPENQRAMQTQHQLHTENNGWSGMNEVPAAVVGSSVNNAIVDGMTGAENRSIGDYKSSDNSFMELNNASGNVILPSLVDYLYQPLGAAPDNTTAANNNIQ